MDSRFRGNDTNTGKRVSIRAKLCSTTTFRYERSSTQRPRFDTSKALLNDHVSIRAKLCSTSGGHWAKSKCRWLS